MSKPEHREYLADIAVYGKFKKEARSGKTHTFEHTMMGRNAYYHVRRLRSVLKSKGFVHTSYFDSYDSFDSMTVHTLKKTGHRIVITRLPGIIFTLEYTHK